MSLSYTSSDEEFDLEEDENVLMLLALHANKRPKHVRLRSSKIMEGKD